MPEGEGRPRTGFDKFWDAYFGVIDLPVKFIRRNVVEPLRLDKENYYYHRQYRRIPGIDECDVGDEVCVFEVNKQFKRDKLVDSEILNILRQRKLECQTYYGKDKNKYCAKEINDYEDAATNFFIRYGDLGAGGTVIDAYMKQKHRMIWERRHGPVGGQAQVVE